MTLINFRFKKYTKEQSWKSTTDHATTIVSKNSQITDTPSTNLTFKARPLKNSYRRGNGANGSIIANGSPKQVAKSDEAKKLYFGQDFTI